MIDVSNVNADELKSYNRRANFGLFLVLLTIGVCLSQIGHWWALLLLIPVIGAFLWYGYWSNKAWAIIEGAYGRRMRP